MTGFTLFKLLFGSEAVTPKEIKNGSPRMLPSENTQDTIKVEKDMIELDIIQASDNIGKYQEETRKWRDKNIVQREIKVGDLILKRKKNWENPGKLQEAWEGPYIVTKSNRLGSFRLADQLGTELPHS